MEQIIVIHCRMQLQVVDQGYRPILGNPEFEAFYVLNLADVQHAEDKYDIIFICFTQY